MHSTNWSFNEFLAFFLIYASHADIHFSEEEEELIKETVSEEIFDAIHLEFKQFTDYQALEQILSYKDVYYSTEEEKEHLLSELHNLFHVDGEYSTLEKELLDFLKRLM